MSVGRLTSPIDIAVSGLHAQSLRLKVIGNNIANAETTSTQGGTPYRRQEVRLETDNGAQSGVRVNGVGVDLKTPFRSEYDPATQAFVDKPNVLIPVEMMRMMAASRAYEANAAVLKRYQAGVDVTLELLK